MGQLAGKTALVTGGTSGIGLAAARRLAEEGAHVYLTGRSQARVDAAVAAVEGSVDGIVGDVTRAEDLDALADAIRANGAGLDVVYANAGSGEFASLEEETPEHLADTLNRNVGGTTFTVQKMLPLLNPGASIVLAGSAATFVGTPSFGAYAASKAAIRSLGRTWAAELADRRIRVNTLVPGPVETPGLKGLAPSGQEQAVVDSQAALTAMGRIAQPDEIANAVVFLASDHSSFMTGAELVVDGGATQV